MADFNPATTAARSADDVYRPVSGWAVAGFAVGVLYAALVALTTIIALVRREPFFLASWFVLVPAAGAIISFIGQRQIQSSEGTRVGMWLAQWGIILSVVVGIGYFAYSLFTGMALTKQAGDFLTVKSGDDSGFLPRLQESNLHPAELNAAFLLTLPANDREGLSKDDDKTLKLYQDQAAKTGVPGPLTRFKTDKLIRAIVQGGQKDTTIESLGTQQWYYDKGAYHVLRRYRISTPEVIFDVVLPAETSRDQKGERKWYVNQPNIEAPSETPTELGKSLTALRRQLFVWLHNNWLAGLNQGDPLPEFDKLDTTQWSIILPSAETRQSIQKALTDLFTGTQVNRLNTLKLTFEDKRAPWKQDSGQLRLHQDFTLDLVLPSGKHYHMWGELVARSGGPIDLRTPPAAPAWQVVEIKFTHAGLVDAAANAN